MHLIFHFSNIGFFEVGGGYLVWIGIREKKLPHVFIPLGCIILGELSSSIIQNTEIL